jgi:hypothetical protein
VTPVTTKTIGESIAESLLSNVSVPFLVPVESSHVLNHVWKSVPDSESSSSINILVIEPKVP